MPGKEDAVQRLCVAHVRHREGFASYLCSRCQFLYCSTCSASMDTCCTKALGYMQQARNTDIKLTLAAIRDPLPTTVLAADWTSFDGSAFTFPSSCSSGCGPPQYTSSSLSAFDGNPGRQQHGTVQSERSCSRQCSWRTVRLRPCFRTYISSMVTQKSTPELTANLGHQHGRRRNQRTEAASIVFVERQTNECVHTCGRS